MNISLGEHARIVRTRQGWSQSELARQCGVSRNEISMIERDIANVRIDTLEKVFSALGYVLAVELREMKPDDG